MFIYGSIYYPSLSRPYAPYLRLFYGHLVYSRVTWIEAACFVTAQFRFIAHVGRM